MRFILQSRLARAEAFLNAHTGSIGGAIAICGFLWRFHHASGFYLNPDEAFHYWVAAQRHWPGWVEVAPMVAHPPLFFLILREVLRFGHSEWVLRLVPMIAGAVFPWFVMLWVRRFTSNAAAVCAQLFLSFSPTLVDLSSEVRGYTLAFLFLSISLVVLEEALERESKLCMTLFHIPLYLAILTEYSVAWVVAAASFYALLRLWRNQRRRDLRITWLVGQLGALALYAFLIVTQVSKWLPPGATLECYLQGAFLQPGQHVLTFVRRGSLNQFRYLLGLQKLPLVALVVAAFVFGLYRLWKNGEALHAMLLLLPFCFSCLGGVFHLFPYGATRHTAVLGISVAASLGCAAAAISRNRTLPIVAAALLVIPIWNLFIGDLYLALPHYRRSLSLMRQSVQFLKSRVPAGSIIVTDQGTYMMLAYYLESRDAPFSSRAYDMYESAGLRFIVAQRVFLFAGDQELREALCQTRHRYHLDGPLWVAAGGFAIRVTNPASSAWPFEKTIAIFRASDAPLVSAENP